MISEAMNQALNDQYTKECYSAQLYVVMASYFEVQALPGFSNWMRVQTQEELSHALIIFNYICDQDRQVTPGIIEIPPADFASTLDIAKKVLAHERLVTASIHKIVSLAIEENDHTTHSFLEWFVKEQLEEEGSAGTMVAQVKRAGDSTGLLLLDKEMAARTFVMPGPLAAGG